jgi:hypothetical protein
LRILTRYILGEISSHSLIGCALFTFILFMKPLDQILEMVVRNSSSFHDGAAGFSVYIAQYISGHDSDGGAGGGVAGVEQAGGGLRDHRDAGFGVRHLVLCARGLGGGDAWDAAWAWRTRCM